LDSRCLFSFSYSFSYYYSPHHNGSNVWLVVSISDSGSMGGNAVIFRYIPVCSLLKLPMILSLPIPARFDDHAFDSSHVDADVKARRNGLSHSKELQEQRKRFLRENKTTDCFDSAAVDEQRCKRLLLIQPILMGLFAILLVYCCWKKSIIRVSDLCYCCCREGRRKRRERDTLDEQREIQQRQLRVMASLRRRERELHRLRLEANARHETVQKRIDDERTSRRSILLDTFRALGLETTLTKEHFVSNTPETKENITADDERNFQHNKKQGSPATSLNSNDEEMNRSEIESHQKQGCFSENEDTGSNENHQQRQIMSRLRVILDRKVVGGCSRIFQSSRELPVATFANECAICLQEYHPKEVIVVSNNPACSHCYHRDCIAEYLTLDFEGKDVDANRGNHHDDENPQPNPSSLSTTTLSDSTRTGTPCPYCRMPFLLGIPRIEDAVLFPSVSSSPST